MTRGKAIVHSDLEELQREAFGYFLHEANPANGPVIDKTAADWPASIAATGLALAAYPVGVECGFMPRDLAVERTLNTLRFSGTARKVQSLTRSRAWLKKRESPQWSPMITNRNLPKPIRRGTR